MQWIKIYIADNEMDASLVKGFLESGGIKVNVVPQSSSSVIQGSLNFTNANIPYAIFVPEEHKDTAEKILATSM